MPTSTKKDAPPAGLTTAGLAVVALAVVLVCAGAALLLATSGGTVTSPAQAAAGSAGRLNIKQEWWLIIFLTLFPSVALILLYRLASRLYRDPQPAAQVAARRFHTLEAPTREDKVALEMALVKDISPAISPEGLEKDTADAKECALEQFSRDREAGLMRYVGLESKSLDTAFDAALHRDDSVFLVEVRYLPGAYARALTALGRKDQDKRISSWLRLTWERAERVAQKLWGDTPAVPVLLFLNIVTSGLSGRGEKAEFNKFEAAVNRNLKYRVIPVTTKFYDLADLRQKFAPEDGAEDPPPAPPGQEQAKPAGAEKDGDPKFAAPGAVLDQEKNNTGGQGGGSSPDIVEEKVPGQPATGAARAAEPGPDPSPNEVPPANKDENVERIVEGGAGDLDQSRTTGDGGDGGGL